MSNVTYTSGPLNTLNNEILSVAKSSVHYVSPFVSSLWNIFSVDKVCLSKLLIISL